MSTKNTKLKSQNGDIKNPILAGATGAVVGAGVAVAAYQVLKEEKTRNKVKQGLSNIKDETLNYAKDVSIEPELKKHKQKIKKATMKINNQVGATV